MKPDPPIDAIRKVRHQISASVGHDPKRLVDYYRKLQKQHQGRIVSRGAPDPTLVPASIAEQIAEHDRELPR